MGCDHDFELGQITTDPWNQLERREWVYYFCRKCLFTVRKPVTTGLDTVTDLPTTDSDTNTRQAEAQ